MSPVSQAQGAFVIAHRGLTPTTCVLFVIIHSDRVTFGGSKNIWLNGWVLCIAIDRAMGSG